MRYNIPFGGVPDQINVPYIGTLGPRLDAPPQVGFRAEGRGQGSQCSITAPVSCCRPGLQCCSCQLCTEAEQWDPIRWPMWVSGMRGMRLKSYEGSPWRGPRLHSPASAYRACLGFSVYGLGSAQLTQGAIASRSGL